MDILKMPERNDLEKRKKIHLIFDLAKSRVNHVNSDQKNDSDVDSQKAYKTQIHITNHKLKDNKDFIRLKYFVKIWKEQAIKIKIDEETAKAKAPLSQQPINAIDAMIKLQQYNNFSRLNEEDDEQEILNVPVDQKEVQVEIQPPKQAEIDPNEVFRMPEADLLMYIPYCTDIYMGKD